jgi:phage baseplate assembly protein W
MATYTGFSTVNAQTQTTYQVETGFFKGVNTPKPVMSNAKKFKLTDTDLIIQDLINALNIPQGSIAGKPWYGTKLWGFIFEPNDGQTQNMIDEEIKRIIFEDSRLILNTIDTTVLDNGVVIEIQLAISPTNQVENIRIFFDQATTRAYANS